MSQAQIDRLIQTPLFNRLVDLRMKQIEENIRRFCEDAKFTGMWTDEVFNYRPSSMLRDRKDQWDEIKKEANFYLNKFPKSLVYGYQEHQELNLIDREEGNTLKSLLGGMFGRGTSLLKSLLNTAVLERKSEEEWRADFAECKKRSDKFEKFYRSLSKEEQRNVDNRYFVIKEDQNGNLKLEIRELTPEEELANQEAAMRQAQLEYVSGGRRRRSHKRHHKNYKTKSAKKGGKSKKHHKKAHRKTHRKH